MPAKDFYHPHVVDALRRDGWSITHDPLSLRIGNKDVFIDLGAERFLGAERDGERIAVEVKSFIGHSEVADLELALGQYVLYRTLLARFEAGRTLYLAVPSMAYESILADDVGRAVREDNQLPIIVVDPKKEEVLRWLK